MKTTYIILPLLCICMAVAAQDDVKIHQHEEDSTDVFFRHLNLNEVIVTGVAGDTKLKHSTAPISHRCYQSSAWCKPVNDGW